MFNSNATLPVSIPLNMGNGFGGGFGGDFDSIIALAIIAMIFGWNNGGIFGGNGGGVQDGYILSSDFANIERKLDSVNNGLCDGFYTQAQLVNGINSNIANLGYNVQAGINGIMTNDSNNARDILSAIADCCCKTQTSFAQAQYNAATEACATRQAITDAKADIIGYLNADKMATLQAENAELRLKASQLDQNNYLVNQLKPCPVPAYVVANPNCNCNGGFPYGYYGGTTIA